METIFTFYNSINWEDNYIDPVTINYQSGFVFTLMDTRWTQTIQEKETDLLIYPKDLQQSNNYHYNENQPRRENKRKNKFQSKLNPNKRIREKQLKMKVD